MHAWRSWTNIGGRGSWTAHQSLRGLSYLARRKQHKKKQERFLSPFAPAKASGMEKMQMTGLRRLRLATSRLRHRKRAKIGRASCRERVESRGGAVAGKQ